MNNKYYIISRVCLVIAILGIITSITSLVLVLTGVTSYALLFTCIAGIVATIIGWILAMKYTDLAAFNGDKQRLKSMNRAIKKSVASRKAEQNKIALERKEAIESAQHPQCPACNGYNTRRIGVVRRSVDVEIFGLASSTIGKQYECLDCQHKW